MAKHLPTGTVSFLFTDIQGSTELLHRLGDQRYGEVLLEHQRLLREAFAQEEGAEVDTQGDAFFVAFPRAWNAVVAAVAAQQALASHPWPEGVVVRVRMGIHTGEPTLVGDHYVGLDVHRAARIAATGYGGQVLLSERTHAMAQARLPAGAEVRDLGEHRLKDLHRPEHIYQLAIPGLPADFPPLKSLEVLVTNLPALQLTSFVGRDREMAEIKAQVAAARLLTLLGPGGTGKTRLALEMGSGLLEQFPKGVWLVELAPLSDPDLVIQTVATVFNVREAPGRPLLDSLIDYLKPRELLLVLDNCEHLIEASARLAGALLRGCPQVRILVTSREPLGVAGEATYRVPPLSRPDPTKRITADQLGEYEASRLFIERAVLSNPQFMVTDRIAPAVARVVHRLDGIPLAIELAAARAKVLSVDQIAARLDDRFRLLTGGARTGPQHHQTLRATIDWSHDLLSAPEQTMFRRLSVFAGGFSLEAAEAVGAGDGIDEMDVLDLVARLVDRSLLVAEEVTGDLRYRMLETIRAYSREKLTAAGEEAAVRGRHLRWYLDLAEEAEPALQGPEQVTWLDRLEMEHDNLRAALEWCRDAGGDKEAGVRLAGALHRFWARRGYLSEGREQIGVALTRAPDAPTAFRAKALYAAAVLAFDQGDYGRAQALGEESLAIFRTLGDDLGVALALNVLAIVARNRGDFDGANRLVDDSETVSRRSHYNRALAEALNIRGTTARRQRNYNGAREILEGALQLWRETGDKSGLAAVLAHLGIVARYQGDFERSRTLLEESLALRRELGDRRNVALALSDLATVALLQGDYQRAVPRLEESLVEFRDLGDKLHIAVNIAYLGLAAARQGALVKAEGLLEDSLRRFEELGDRSNMASALGYLAGVVAQQGDLPRGATLYREALEIFRLQGDRLGVAETLVGLAGFLPVVRSREAARLLGAAEALYQNIGIPMWPAERGNFERAVAVVSASLDLAAFEADRAAGRVLSLEDAVAAALNLLASSSAAPF